MPTEENPRARTCGREEADAGLGGERHGTVVLVA